jgi:hypothetical protein
MLSLASFHQNCGYLQDYSDEREQKGNFVVIRVMLMGSRVQSIGEFAKPWRLRLMYSVQHRHIAAQQKEFAGSHHSFEAHIIAEAFLRLGEVVDEISNFQLIVFE